MEEKKKPMDSMGKATDLKFDGAKVSNSNELCNTSVSVISFEGVKAKPKCYTSTLHAKKTITRTKKHGIVETEEVNEGMVMGAALAVTNNTPDAHRSQDLAEAINDELEGFEAEADVVPEVVGMLRIKSANDTLNEASQRPDPIPLWKSLLYEGEVCCLFADSNLGKSIYAVQIATSIAQHQKVLYFDFELSDKQFQLRYTNKENNVMFKFPDNLYRVEIDNEFLEVEDFEDSIISNIENSAIMTGAKVLIIDNLTWICNNSEKGSDAGVFMMKLMALKKKYNFSILVIAHTPKRPLSTPLTPNDLAGSKKLYNFFDSAFAIGQSAKDPGLRYIKQMKVRYGGYDYGADNVIVCTIEQDENAFLRFNEIDFATEKEHLREPSENDEAMLVAEVRRLKDEGLSYRDIAKRTGISKSKVGRVLESK